VKLNETRIGICVALTVALGLPVVTTAAATAVHYSRADFATVRKFDAHVHINAAPTEFSAQARRDGFDVLTINVDYPDFPTIAQQADIASRLHAAEPQHIQFATTFSMQGWGLPDWNSRTIERLDAAFATGAVAVKVWKNIGMVEKDAAGKLITINDPGFDPLIAHLIKHAMPLIGHLGEPKNCWLPLDQMTTENDRSYFREHPQYHMFLHPDQPGYEAQMSARDQFVARHPDLHFVGAHMASLEWSVDELARFLDANPLAVVDLAARMTQVQYQSAADRSKVRDFFIRYQDRLLYGSDASINPTDKVSTAMLDTHKAWRSDWTYLATTGSQYIADLKRQIKGLALPRAVIDKVYWQNAQNTFLGRK
jgi:predicted TIM-barrel fold metal-dependent hydrolase